MKQKYITKRQPTFFPKEVEVTLEQLKEIFTDKAIKAMVEDGFLEKVSKDKEWLDYLDAKIKSHSSKTVSETLLSAMLAFKDKGTKVMLHDLREDQIDQIIGEFHYVKRVNNKIALHIAVPKKREQEVHRFFTRLVTFFSDYTILSDEGTKNGWIYGTKPVLYVTEVVEKTVGNCLIITEYK